MLRSHDSTPLITPGRQGHTSNWASWGWCWPGCWTQTSCSPVSPGRCRGWWQRTSPSTEQKKTVVDASSDFWEAEPKGKKEVEKEKVVRDVAPREGEGFPCGHRCPCPGGPGSGRATLLFIFFHSLLPGVPYSGWTNEYICTQSSRLSGAWSGWCPGQVLIFPSTRKRSYATLFINTFRHLEPLASPEGTRDHSPNPISILPYQRLQMWRWLYQKTARRSSSLPSRGGCWDLESPKRK